MLGICLLFAFAASAQEEKKMLSEIVAKSSFGTASITTSSNVDRNIILIGAGSRLRYPLLSSSENNLISIGATPTLGLFYDSEFDEDFMVYGFELPILFEYSLGRGATKNSTGRAGVYIGGGYDFLLSSVAQAGTIFAHGPIANVGFKFRIFNVEYNLFGSVMKPLNQPGIVIGSGGRIIPDPRRKYKNGGSGGGKSSDLRSGGWEWIY